MSALDGWRGWWTPIGAGCMSFAVQVVVGVGVYWLRVDQNITRPGSHAAIAGLLNSDVVLFAAAPFVSVLACTAMLTLLGPSSLQENVATAIKTAVVTTLVTGMLAFPVGIIVALNTIGS